VKKIKKSSKQLISFLFVFLSAFSLIQERAIVTNAIDPADAYVNLSAVTGDVTISNSGISANDGVSGDTSDAAGKTVSVSGAGSASDILVSVNCTLILDAVSCRSIQLKNSANVTVYTAEGRNSTINATGIDHAGIEVPGGATVNIYGLGTAAGWGTLTVTGGNYSAGIGGGRTGNTGTVNIYDGNIKSTGGASSDGRSCGAGIGGGFGSTVISVINIMGGKITAAGGGKSGSIIYGGAGIGSGGHSNYGVGGTKVSVSGGTVTAAGGSAGAGIGGGYGNSGNVEINISGGTIENASGGTASNGGAGIGGGAYCSYTTINISGDAWIKRAVGAGSTGGAGIGSGYYYSSGSTTINISDDAHIDSVQGAGWAAGIGNGSATYNQSSNPPRTATVTIGGNAVIGTSTGGSNGAGIGAGYSTGSNPGVSTVIIKDHASVTAATGASNGYGGIGRGMSQCKVTITTDGEVKAYAKSVPAIYSSDTSETASYLVNAFFTRDGTAYYSPSASALNFTVEGAAATTFRLPGGYASYAYISAQGTSKATASNAKVVYNYPPQSLTDWDIAARTGVDLQSPSPVTFITTAQVIYESEGNPTSMPPAETIIVGNPYTLPDIIPERNFYTFTGWKLTAGTVTEESDSFNPGDTVTPQSGITLDAEWEQQMYTVSYDLNEGAGDFPEDTVAAGSNYTVTNQEPTLAGHTFTGWLAGGDVDIDGNTFMPNDSFTVLSDVLLTAQWAPLVYPYTVEYYRGSMSETNLIETVTGNVSFAEGHQLTAEDIMTDLGDSWINGKRPASGYNSGSVQGGYPVISQILEDNTVKILYTPTGGGGGTTYYTVKVKYQDTSGNAIEQEKNTSVARGNSYSISAHTIQGHRYEETVLNGTASDNRDVVIDSVTMSYEIVFRYALDRPVFNEEIHDWYVLGYPGNVIKPDDNISRAETAMIFYRLVANGDKDAKQARHVLTDIDASSWYAKAVTYLYDYDIITGYPDGTYKPDLPITRAEIAAMASMFDNLDIPVENTFSDVPPTHWAYSYIGSAARKGWVQGYDDGTFLPYNYANRAEIITFINNVLGRRVKTEGLLPDVHAWDDLPPDYWAYSDIMEATHSHTYERQSETDYETWLSVTGTGLGETSNQ
jgi:hypothetical protein